MRDRYIAVHWTAPSTRRIGAVTNICARRPAFEAKEKKRSGTISKASLHLWSTAARPERMTSLLFRIDEGFAGRNVLARGEPARRTRQKDFAPPLVEEMGCGFTISWLLVA
jgi:hypothetical protein